MSGIKGKSGVYKRTTTARKNIALAAKGRVPWNKDKKMPKNVGEAVRLARLGKFGKLSHNWKGGRRKFQGYIKIYKPEHPFATKKCVFEHRLVVEQQIGRYLKPEERIHHINGIKDDNRPENLMAFSDEISHQKFENNPKNVQSKDIVFDGRSS
jgi:hypothetical protein